MKRTVLLSALWTSSMLLSAQTKEEALLFSSPEGMDESYLLSDSVSVSFADGSANLLVGGVKQSGLNLENGNVVSVDFKKAFKISAEQDPNHPENYYATFYTNEGAYKVPADGSVTANTGSVKTTSNADKDIMELTSVADENNTMIPAGEAVVLKSSQSEILLMPSCSKKGTSTENELVGTEVQIEETSENNYAFSVGEYGVGFYPGKTISANSAYVTLNESAKVKYILFSTYLYNAIFYKGTSLASSGSVSPDTRLSDNTIAVVTDDVDDELDITQSRNVVWNFENGLRANSIALQDTLDMYLPNLAFHVDSFSYDRVPTSDTITFVSPVAIPADKLNGTAYILEDFANSTLYFNTVTGDLEANTPYIVVVANKGERLIDDMENTEWEIDDDGMPGISVNGLTHYGNLSETRVEYLDKSPIKTYIYQNSEFVQVSDSLQWKPFRTIFKHMDTNPSPRPRTFGIAFNGNTTGVVLVGEGELVSGPVTVFDALGRIVRANVESTTCLQDLKAGVYVVNGQKFIVKE